MQNNGRNTKNKTFKHLKHIVKPYDKPEHILNVIVQGSDNKILFIKIVFNEGKRKITALYNVCLTRRCASSPAHASTTTDCQHCSTTQRWKWVSGSWVTASDPLTHDEITQYHYQATYFCFPLRLATI